MLGSARLDAPAALYHIMIRGDRAQTNISGRCRPGGFSFATGEASARDWDILFCLGADSESFSPAAQDGE